MPDFGTFALDTATRTAKGYLLPWGVKSKGTSSSKTAPITFERGSITLPRDPMVVGLNREHGRFDVLGRATAVEDHEAGLYAEFAIANTEEGDAWLADHGETAYFSAEIDRLTRAPGDLGAGVLAGAAVTAAPAFEGTGLFSLIAPETVLEAAPETTDEATASTDTEEPDTEEPEDTEGDGDMAEAMAPTAPASRKPKAEAPRLTRHGLFSALQSWAKTGDVSALRPFTDQAEEVGLFALNDVTFDGTGGLTTEAGFPATWLGELWQGRRFQRRVVPLLSSGTLTSMSAHGWIWDTKPAMGVWGGNKTDVPSNDPTVSPQTFPAQRYAGGHDLAREYRDFGITEVIESYAQAMVDSYAMLTDAAALNAIAAGGTAFTPDAATENVGLSAVIDGALAVVAASATPSFAIVAPDVYKDVIKTPHSDALEYFSASVGLDGGQSAGFRIIPDARLTAGDVIVGAREAATVWELPGSPIRVSLPDLVKGGIDEAFFGYAATGVTYPDGIVVGTVTIV